MATNLHFNLCQAAANGDLTQVQLLIKKGADVNFSSYTDSTPLLLAIENGKDDVLSELLDCGAEVSDTAKKLAEEKNNEFAIKELQNTEANRAREFINVPFVYDRTTGHGTLTKVGCNVSIDRSQLKPFNFKRHLQLCMRVDHKAFFFVTGEEELSIHKRFDMTLSRYLEQNICKPFDTYTIPNSTSQYRYLVDFYRVMLRDMVDFITYLHDIDISVGYADFTMKNIGVKGKEKSIIFFGILLCDADDVSKKQDFKSLASLIKSVIAQGDALAQAAAQAVGGLGAVQGAVQAQGQARPPYPADIQDIFTKLSNLSPTNARWLKDHIAFLSPKERDTFMHKVHTVNNYQSLPKPHIHDQIVSSIMLSRENNPNWTKRFCSGDANSPVPHNYAEQECLCVLACDDLEDLLSVAQTFFELLVSSKGKHQTRHDIVFVGIMLTLF